MKMVIHILRHVYQCTVCIRHVYAHTSWKIYYKIRIIRTKSFRHCMLFPQQHRRRRRRHHQHDTVHTRTHNIFVSGVHAIIED